MLWLEIVLAVAFVVLALDEMRFSRPDRPRDGCVIRLDDFRKDR